MKKRFVYIGIITMLGILLVTILYQISLKPKHITNGFVRHFAPHILGEWEAIEIPSNLSYIGSSNQNVYLGNYTNPEVIYSFDLKSNNLNTLQFTIPQNQKVAWKAIRIYANTHGIFITEGISPKILFADFNKRSFKPMPIPPVYFTECLPISSETYIVNTYDRDLNQRVLASINTKTSEIIKNPNLLTKQIDGMFCTEGILQSIYNTQKLLYLYHYRNEYLVFNTDLKLEASGQTIDTIKVAQLSVSTYHQKNKLKSSLSSPPLLVNKNSRTFDNNMFVVSNVMADNETPDAFKNKTVIDVYTLNDQRYMYSFYLPLYHEQKVNDFMILNHSLVGLYNNHLVKFKIKLP